MGLEEGKQIEVFFDNKICSKDKQRWKSSKKTSGLVCVCVCVCMCVCVRERVCMYVVNKQSVCVAGVFECGTLGVSVLNQHRQRHCHP